MSAVGELADLRHELRTPINHIMGFCEIVAEDAQGTPYAAQMPLLTEVRELGQELLTLVNEGVAPTRTQVSEEALRELGRQLHPPLSRIRAITATLEAEAQKLRMASIVADVGSIRQASVTMQTLADGLLARVPAKPASVEALEASKPQSLFDFELPEVDLIASHHPLANRCYRILVVDDNAANRELLVRRLSKEGYRVIESANGSDALERMRSELFDLALLDVMLPGLSGVEVLEALKADPSTRDVPVIMISALDALASVVRCIDKGAEDYLSKPFNPTVLRARVSACLEKKRLRDLELDYLRGVRSVAAAAEAVEDGRFHPDDLASVAARYDDLGRLATVFTRMAEQVGLRVQHLRQQVEDLRVQIDLGKKSKQVAEITGTDFFQALRLKAEQLRKRPLREANG